MRLVDRVDELSGATGELSKPIDILLGVIQAILATSFVQGGASVGTDQRDVTLRINDSD